MGSFQRRLHPRDSVESDVREDMENHAGFMHGLPDWEMESVISVAILIVLAMLMWCALTCVLDRVLGKLISTLDRYCIGTDIYFRRLHLTCGCGYFCKYRGIGFSVLLTDLRVANPVPYTGECAFKAARVSFDIRVWPLLASCGARVELQSVAVTKLHATLEYAGGRACSCVARAFTGTSNIQAILNFMKGKRPSEYIEHGATDALLDKGAMCLLVLAFAFAVGFALMSFRLTLAHLSDNSATAELVFAVSVTCFIAFEMVFFFVPLLAVARRAVRRDAVDVVVHKLDVQDMTVTTAEGLTMQVADVYYDNFTEEVGSFAADDVLYIGMQSILKTILSGAVGHEAAQEAM